MHRSRIGSPQLGCSGACRKASPFLPSVLSSMRSTGAGRINAWHDNLVPVTIQHICKSLSIDFGNHLQTLQNRVTSLPSWTGKDLKSLVIEAALEQRCKLINSFFGEGRW